MKHNFWYIKRRNMSLINNESLNSNKIPKNLCIFTLICSFIFGIIIGICIPIYILPNNDILLKHNQQVPKNVLQQEHVIQSSSSVSSQQQQQPQQLENYKYVSFVPKTANKTLLIEDGIYWSSNLEEKMPKLKEWNDAESWGNYVKKSSIIKMIEGCGRMQNRLITFTNGTQSCCRYRQNIDQIQGEIFSYYLGAKVFNFSNLPPSALLKINLISQQWSNVKVQLKLANWMQKTIVVTKYINNLQASYIPEYFKSKDNRRLHPNDIKPDANYIQLMQWSDLIIFDYLTANLDRIVNNLYNLQWNPSMMDAPAHNLMQTSSGLLVFLDNESGLLHGYRLLEKYNHYHYNLLQSLCVFRRQTSNIIKQLYTSKNIGKILFDIFNKHNDNNENNDLLPFLPQKSIKILNERIADVYDQIMKCESLYKN